MIRVTRREASETVGRIHRRRYNIEEPGSIETWAMLQGSENKMSLLVSSSAANRSLELRGTDGLGAIFALLGIAALKVGSRVPDICRVVRGVVTSHVFTIIKAFEDVTAACR